MEDFKSPVPVEWQNKLVLTTTQLAEYYGCAVENIRDNFRKNKIHFVESKHYFKLEGDAFAVPVDETRLRPSCQNAQYR